ncbi:MAG: hypothetical protein PF542_04480 [Nanoarchaeota archaeon]|jgi:hypothetical protein|nr:hypothetical protein [Nanoarchaeota archaeon]
MEKKIIPVVNDINLRDSPEDNKFVQLNVDNKPYLRFIRPTDVRYHFDILGSTLIDEFEIVPEFENGGITKAEGERYNMTGLGNFREGVVNGKIEVYESLSKDYPFHRIDREGLEEVSKLTGLEFKVLD